jgi:hypothetical protein
MPIRSARLSCRTGASAAVHNGRIHRRLYDPQIVDLPPTTRLCVSPLRRDHLGRTLIDQHAQRTVGLERLLPRAGPIVAAATPRPRRPMPGTLRGEYKRGLRGFQQGQTGRSLQPQTHGPQIWWQNFRSPKIAPPANLVHQADSSAFSSGQNRGAKTEGVETDVVSSMGGKI